MSHTLATVGHVLVGTAIAIIGATACLLLVTIASLGARRPATRRHHLRLIRELTEFIRATRGER